MKKDISSFRLDGKNALVNGDSAAALAAGRALEGAGARVFFRGCWNRPEFGAEKIFPGDLSTREDADSWIRNFRGENGELDILVNAPETANRQAAELIAPEDWRIRVRQPLREVFFACQSGGAAMLARSSGVILNITSVAGSLGIAGTLTHSAWCGAVDQLTRTLGVEWAARGVRVNGIAPWPAGLSDAAGSGSPPRIPCGETPGPDAIGGAAVYLASDTASMVTGQILNVDGGYSQQ